MQKFTVDRSKWAISGCFNEFKEFLSPGCRFENYKKAHPENFFGAKENFLLDIDSGNMCCLGFACNQIVGLEKEALEGYSMPISLVVKPLEWSDDLGHYTPESVKSADTIYTMGLSPFVARDELASENNESLEVCVEYCSSDLAEIAAEINDSSFLTPQEKEEELIKLFSQYDIEVTFTGTGWWENAEKENKN